MKGTFEWATIPIHITCFILDCASYYVVADGRLFLVGVIFGLQLACGLDSLKLRWLAWKEMASYVHLLLYVGC